MIPDPARSALKDRTVVVIGGTTGIGLSAARAFVLAGARVVVVGLDAESVAQAGAELGDAGSAICADATRPETTPTAIQQALKRFGGFHGLYHVAGGSGRKWGDGPLHELTDEGWRATLDLNLTSVMYSNRAAVQQFQKQGTGGSVLNVSSVLALSPSPGFFATHAYTTAKSAIIGFTRGCAAYYAPHNIRFNVLAPGLTATPMSRRAQADPKIGDYVRFKQPLDHGRMAQPSDLDAAAVYFFSEGSRFTTGQVLEVDGGWSVSEGRSPGAL